MQQEFKPKVLGEKSALPDHPYKAILEAIPVEGMASLCVRFTCPEFTSLCPVTSQPDFATIVLDFVPKDLLVASKSLKLYLGAYRNHAAFHEAVCRQMVIDLVKTINPLWMRLACYFYPRGGIPIDVFWQSGDPPKGIYIPALEVPQYRGR